MIGLIGAMDIEIEILISKLENKETKEISGYKFYLGSFGKNEVVIVKCGIGKVAAAVGATILIENFKPEVIINTGIAGGAEGLVQRDVVIAKEIKYHDVDATGFGYKLGQMPGQPEIFTTDKAVRLIIQNTMSKLKLEYKDGNILSGDSFITSYNQLIIKPVGPTAVEMEGAAIAETCHILGTRFASIRFISDVVGGSDQAVEYNVFEREAAQESAEICYNVVKNF